MTAKAPTEGREKIFFLVNFTNKMSISLVIFSSVFVNLSTPLLRYTTYILARLAVLYLSIYSIHHSLSIAYAYRYIAQYVYAYI